MSFPVKSRNRQQCESSTQARWLQFGRLVVFLFRTGAAFDPIFTTKSDPSEMCWAGCCRVNLRNGCRYGGTRSVYAACGLVSHGIPNFPEDHCLFCATRPRKQRSYNFKAHRSVNKEERYDALHARKLGLHRAVRHHEPLFLAHKA
jgi:hypothetical protein